MADQTTNRGMGDEERHQQEASEGLHIYGRGHEALEDGAEQPAESGQQQGSDDVFGNANIQSGRRSTFEGMIDGQPEPRKDRGGAAPHRRRRIHTARPRG